MDSWEYQVIHINVEPPRPAAPPPAADGPSAAPPAAGGASLAKPMFSETFLKKEFPQFYEKPSGEGSPSQSQHPAHQLQTFLNGHGAQGWELVGVFPVGNLTLMFFRRPRPAGVKPAAPVGEASAPLADRRSLDHLHQRLDQLESRLGGPAAASAPSSRRQTARPETRRSATRTAASSERVSPAQLASLADQTPLPSSRAALAIGLRSATSLANHGARFGYEPGLRKRGPNGLVAIYTGPGGAEKGGKERRLWIVVPADRLEG